MVLLVTTYTFAYDKMGKLVDLVPCVQEWLNCGNQWQRRW